MRASIGGACQRGLAVGVPVSIGGACQRGLAVGVPVSVV